MKNYFRLLLLTIALLCSADQHARSQWVHATVPSKASANCFAVIGTNLFAGTSDTGVCISTNNGTDWTRVSAGLTHCPVTALAAISANLFAGLYDYQMTGLGGVFLSTNNGTTWSKTSLKNADIKAMAVSGTTLWIVTGDNRIMFSSNNGSTWKSSSNGLTSSSLSAIASDGVNVFVGTAVERNTPDVGVFLSTNGGTSWKQSNNGLTNTTIYSLSASGTNVYAGAFIGDNAVYASTNSGTQWVGEGLAGYIGTALAVSGSNLFLATADGIDQGSVQLTTNNGTTWMEVNTGLSTAYINAIAIGGSYLFVFSNDGVWRRPLAEMPVDAVEPSMQAQHAITTYPNPFSQSTQITFTSQAAGYAEVSIVNMLGVEVARLLTGELGAGEHSFLWDCRGALQCAPTDGVYECLVRMNGQVETLPVVMIR